MTDAVAKKAPPIADAKIKVNGDYVTIGTQWTTGKRGITSVNLDRAVDSFILVNRTPKPKAKVVQAAKPAA
jgi:hypothetical protein